MDIGKSILSSSGLIFTDIGVEGVQIWTEVEKNGNCFPNLNKVQFS